MAYSTNHNDVGELVRVLMGESGVPPREESMTALQMFFGLVDKPRNCAYTLVVQQPRSPKDPIEIRLLTGKFKLMVDSD